MPALRRRTVFNVERNWFGSSRFFNKLSQARTRLCQTLDRDLGIRTVFVHVHNSTQPFASELHYGLDIGTQASPCNLVAMVSKVAAAMVWLGTDGSRRHAANSGKKFRARLLQWPYEVSRPAAFGEDRRGHPSANSFPLAEG